MSKPAFTKRHYTAVASVLADATPETVAAFGLASPIESMQCGKADLYRYGASDARAFIAKRLADAFADDNPRFDSERFYAACGLDGVS